MKAVLLLFVDGTMLDDGRSGIGVGHVVPLSCDRIGCVATAHLADARSKWCALPLVLKSWIPATWCSVESEERRLLSTAWMTMIVQKLAGTGIRPRGALPRVLVANSRLRTGGPNF